ncbi:MAG: thiocillin family RiPP [Nocardioides sp.]
MSHEIDLYVTDELAIEEMPQGNALGSFFSLTSASSASCPATSASSLTTASSFS